MTPPPAPSGRFGIDRSLDTAVETEHRSHWLREVLPYERIHPPLRGTASADVAILGGGFVGLWTAIRIKRQRPDCSVAVLERDVCGSGASGRNGGMALSWWPKLASLVSLCGEQEALRLARSSSRAVEEIGSFCEEHGIDCQYHLGGLLWTATNRAQADSWRSVVALCERLGERIFTPVAADELARRTGSPAHIAGVFEQTAAILQPAALVRGLRRVAAELGIKIYEHTSVTGFTRTAPAKVTTQSGATLDADKVVVALNAWATRLPELSRALISVSSDVFCTPPIPNQLEQIGWAGGEAVIDSQTMVDYYRTTRDGRIVFGKGTASLGYSGQIGAGFARGERRIGPVIADFRRYYPELGDVPVDRHWGGPIDRTANSVPILGHLGDNPNILYGVGWSGNGVAPSLIGGRILASLALDREDEWSRSELVDRSPDLYPPEPLRFLGGQLVRAAVAHKDRAERTDRAPARVAAKLAALAPAGLEDKS